MPTQKQIFNADQNVINTRSLIRQTIQSLNYYKLYMMMRRSSTTISTKSRANFNIVVVGERGVGKTSLLMRYDRGMFCKTFAVTIGIESFNKQLVINSERVALQMWDTAGQDGFKSLVKSYYSRASCVIIVYSDPLQLKRTIEGFLKEIGQHASQHVIVACVRSKIDMKPLSQEENSILKQYHTHEKIKLWMEVSAKEGTNVQCFFEELGATLLEKYEEDYQFKQLVSPMKKKSILISKTDLGHMEAQRKSVCCNA